MNSNSAVPLMGWPTFPKPLPSKASRSTKKHHERQKSMAEVGPVVPPARKLETHATDQAHGGGYEEADTAPPTSLDTVHAPAPSGNSNVLLDSNSTSKSIMSFRGDMVHRAPSSPLHLSHSQKATNTIGHPYSKPQNWEPMPRSMLELDGADEGGYATFAQHTRIDASTKPSIMSIFKASSTSEEKYVPQPIFADEIYLARLRALVPTKGTLESKGYTLRELASYELENKKRCKNCSKVIKPRKKGGDLSALAASNLRAVSNKPSAPKKDAAPGKDEMHNCHYHPGRSQNGYYTCCSKRTLPSTPLCTSSLTHTPMAYHPGELATLYQLHRTPPNPRGLPVVALDCEMGTARSGDSELIKVSLINYFSGQTLMDDLVYPYVPMSHLNFKYSGVTWDALNAARKDGTALKGITGAREKVWQFVGPQTIVVAHSGSNDLSALKWIHPLIVDTFLLEPEPRSEIEARERAKEKREKERNERAEMEMAGKKNKGNGRAGLKKETRKDLMSLVDGSAGADALATSSAQATGNVDGAAASTSEIASNADPTSKPKAHRTLKGAGPRALKRLTEVKLGRKIQMGKQGHSSEEDALAARDLCHWTMVNGMKGVEEILAEMGVVDEEDGKGEKRKRNEEMTLGEKNGEVGPEVGGRETSYLPVGKNEELYW